MSFPTLPRPRLLRRWSLLPLLLAVLSACTGRGETSTTGETRGVLLVGNTRGDSVVVVDEESGELLATLISAGGGGLVAPDAMVFGPDGFLYIASGDTVDNSAILRFDPRNGNFIDRFASGNGLLRPSGLAFGPDNLLYVSSFLTDQLLRYDATTGAFVDIFARGSGRAGGLNGPNQLRFGPDGLLYVTTEGTVAIGGQPTFPGLPSQVLRFNLLTGALEVFADQPQQLPDGAGYVSLRGLEFGPSCEIPGGDCDLFVSDFANGIRRYDLSTKQLEATLATNYLGTPAQNNLGGIAFGAQGRLYAVGFDNKQQGGLPGAVLRFHAPTNTPFPAEGKQGALFVGPTNQLVRPIGLLYQRRPTGG